jgi:hypothetical protein
VRCTPGTARAPFQCRPAASGLHAHVCMSAAVPNWDLLWHQQCCLTCCRRQAPMQSSTTGLTVAELKHSTPGRQHLTTQRLAQQAVTRWAGMVPPQLSCYAFVGPHTERLTAKNAVTSHIHAAIHAPCTAPNPACVNCRNAQLSR